MTFKEFNFYYYNPIWKRNNGKKISEIPDAERMVLAIGNSEIILDANQYESFHHLLSDIAIISGDNNFKTSKEQELDKICKLWKVEKTKLIENVKKMFSKKG